MGTIYRLPKLDIDISIGSFNTTTPNTAQLELFNNIVANGISGYAVKTGLYGWVKTCFATTVDNILIAFVCNPSNNQIGFCIRSNGATANVVYDRDNNPKLYGYDIINYATGIQQTIASASNYSEINMLLDYYSTVDDAVNALNDSQVDTYPITYHYTNSIVSGPSEAAVGDNVTVSAVPDVGYGITDASTQILVTNNDVAVPYTWDAMNNRITFTMPDPS